MRSETEAWDFNTNQSRWKVGELIDETEATDLIVHIAKKVADENYGS